MGHPLSFLNQHWFECQSVEVAFDNERALSLAEEERGVARSLVLGHRLIVDCHGGGQGWRRGSRWQRWRTERRRTVGGRRRRVVAALSLVLVLVLVWRWARAGLAAKGTPDWDVSESFARESLIIHKRSLSAVATVVHPGGNVGDSLPML